MSEMSQVKTGSARQDAVIALLIACAGAVLYIGLTYALGAWLQPRIGQFIYNQYFLSILDGEFHIPARIAAVEGHYDSAGRAFIYHGLAPLVTRAIAWPFIDLAEISLAPVTILVFAILGTAIYHLTLFRIVARFGPDAAALRSRLALLVGAMVWLTSPGPILAANEAFYHEPVAIAYATSAGMIALMAEVAIFGTAARRVLIPCAVLAGITVHARPEMAIGLYAAVCLLAALVLHRDGRGAIGRVVAAMAVLFAFGALLLGFNALRFGDVTQLHGETGEGAIEYGYTFWEFDDYGYFVEALRTRAEHGTFNAGRILPNAILYLADIPYGPPASALMSLFERLTDGTGITRVERPRLGLVFFWLPWVLLALASLRYLQRQSRHGWALLAGTGLAALMMLSYPTITLRYRVILWPVLASLVVLGLPHIVSTLSTVTRPMGRLTVLAGATALGTLSMLAVVATYYDQSGGGPRNEWGPWSFEYCAERVMQLDMFSQADIDRICSL